MFKISSILVTFLFLSWAEHGFSSHHTPLEAVPDKQYGADGGLVWPKPQQMTNSASYFTLDPSRFQFILSETRDCDLLNKAIKRYEKLVFVNDCSLVGDGLCRKPISKIVDDSDRHLNDVNYLGEIQNITINLRTGGCEDTPHLHMDEMYTLRINSPDFPNEMMLFANRVWGLIRGLETFSQLVYVDNGQFKVQSTIIVDYPRYSHRGLLIDSSRHFLSMRSIREHIDAMAYNKMNVLHWHIVDDQSFPYVSENFPDLSQKGAYNPETHIYTPKDVQDIIEYSRERGIRVLPEFDTPGHTQAWGKGQPGLLTPCYDKTGKLNGQYGPIDPTLDDNYVFLRKLFEEVSQVFSDDYVHLGGDEVSFDCWQSSPVINDFMAKVGIPAGYYEGVESYHIQKLLDIVQGTNRSYIVWQEVFDHHDTLKDDTVIHVWKGNTQEYQNEMAQVTAKGYQAILSTPWYLNEVVYGPDWSSNYQVEPETFNGTAAQKKLVMGGEACMWGEYIDGNNGVSNTWARASSVAERLWSAKEVNDVNEALPRIKAQSCRMQARGIHVEPINGPGFCPCDYAL